MSSKSSSKSDTPDVYKHDRSSMEWCFFGSLASNGYTHKLSVENAFGSFEYNQAVELKTKFFSYLELKKNTLKYRWRNFTNSTTLNDLKLKLTEACYIAQCPTSTPQLTGIALHPTFKQEWLEHIKSLDFDTQSLAESFPVGSFKESSLLDELYVLKIPIPNAAWIIKLFYTTKDVSPYGNVNNTTSSTSSNSSGSSLMLLQSPIQSPATNSISNPHSHAHSQSSNVSHTYKDSTFQKYMKEFGEMLINFAIDPLFDKKPVDIEMTRYFIHLSFYCTEERILDSDIFEEWLISKERKLTKVFSRYYAKQLEKYGKDIETQNQSLKQMLTSLSTLTRNTFNSNPTDFIMKHILRSVNLDSPCGIHAQERLLLEGLLQLVHKLSRNLPAFCRKLTSIQCGEITYELLRSLDESDVQTDVDIDIEQYSRVSVLRKLDSIFSSGDIDRVYRHLFSTDRHYAKSISLLFKWSSIDIIEGLHDHRRVYVCCALLERLNLQLLQAKSRGSTTTFRKSSVVETGNRNDSSLHFSSHKVHPITPSIIDQFCEDGNSKNEFPLQKHLHLVLEECESITKRDLESETIPESSKKFRLSNIFQIFSYLEERGIFSFQSYSDWIIKENRLKFGIERNKSLEDAFHYKFLKNCAIYQQKQTRLNDKTGTIDSPISNEVRIRRIFLQRLGEAPQEDEALGNHFISYFPKAFHIRDQFSEEVLRQILSASTFCQFMLTRHLRNIILISLYDSNISTPQEVMEEYLKLIFYLMNEIGDFRSFELVIIGICRWIVKVQKENSPQATRLENFVMSAYLNSFEIFVYSGYLALFIQQLKDTPPLLIQDDLLSSLWYRASRNLSILSKNNYLAEIKQARSTEFKLNLHSVLQIANGFRLSKEKLFNPLLQVEDSQDAIILTKERIVHLTQIRYNLMRGGLQIIDIHNALIDILKRYIQTNRTLKPFIQLLYSCLSYNIISVPSLLKIVLTTCDDIDGNSLTKIDVIMLSILSPQSEYYPVVENNNLHSLVLARYLEMQMSCCTLHAFPKLLENLLNVYEKFKEHNREQVLQILKRVLTSKIVIRHLPLTTRKLNYLAETLESLYSRKSLSDEDRDNVIASIFEQILPEETELKPLIICSFENYIEKVKMETNLWKSWASAAILYSYSCNTQLPVEEISELLINPILDSKDSDLYSYYITFLCRSSKDFSTSLKKKLFTKFKSVVRDSPNTNWVIDVERITYSLLENCKSDYLLAIAVCETLSMEINSLVNLSSSTNYLFPSSKSNVVHHSDAIDDGKNFNFIELQERVITTLQVMTCVISHLDDPTKKDIKKETKKKEDPILSIVRNLFNLFFSRLGQMESLYHCIHFVDTFNKHIEPNDITISSEKKYTLETPCKMPNIRNYIFKILQIIESQHASFISSVDSFGQQFSEFTQQNSPSRDPIQYINPWGCIEGVSYVCKSCKRSHTQHHPSHTLQCKVIEKGESFYHQKKQLGKRSRENGMDSLENDSLNLFSHKRSRHENELFNF